jgi:hypothetical protein
VGQTNSFLFIFSFEPSYHGELKTCGIAMDAQSRRLAALRLIFFPSPRLQKW